jgi:hypothetical protein
MDTASRAGSASELPVATIAVRRQPGGQRDIFRAYRIVVDGKTVGKIRRGQSREVQVSPGSHTLVIAIDWGSSPMAQVELQTGDRAAFVCEPGGSAETALVTSLFDRHAYISLSWDVSARARCVPVRR